MTLAENAMAVAAAFRDIVFEASHDDAMAMLPADDARAAIASVVADYQSTTEDAAPAASQPAGYGWRCQECGRTFRALKAAERAQSEGCPACGGCDVDFTMPAETGAGNKEG